jgi:hypothetical protein
MDIVKETFKICDRYADRSRWAKVQLQSHIRFNEIKLNQLSNNEIAILDQFSTRFCKLHDLMGSKLFPAVLELTKEPGELKAFIDKLNRLEKVGAIPSTEDWLLMREVRNTFSHDYPDDPQIQEEMLIKALGMAAPLLEVLNSVKYFIQPYLG